MRESLCKYWKLQSLCHSLSLSLFVSVFVFVFLFVHIQLQSLLRRPQIKDGAQAVASTRLRSLWVCKECVCFVCECVWCRFSHFRLLLKIFMMICYFCACVFCSLFSIEYPKAHPTGNDVQIADTHTHTHTHMIHTHQHSHSHLKRKQSKWISLLISLLLDGTLLWSA